MKYDMGGVWLSLRCAWVWCFPPNCITWLRYRWSPACPHESSEKWRWTAGVDGLEFV